MTTFEAGAYFEPEGDRFRPTAKARGPWNPDSLHGRVIAGLLGRTLEQRYGDDSLQFARLSVDLFRQAPMSPLEVETQLVRDGNRIRVAEAILTANGVEIARGRGVLLRRTDRPAGAMWRPPDWHVPSPEEAVVAPHSAMLARTWEVRSIDETPDGQVAQKRVWLREQLQLVAGEALTPFVRCAVAADYTNPFANSGATGLNFVNADVTLYLHRLPVNEWLGFELASHQSAEGIAVGEATLYDLNGAIGKSIVCAVANQRPA